MDSLYNILKTAKEDTARVNAWNDIGWELYLESNYAQSDSISKCALQLAQKIDFKKGQSTAYRNIGLIDDKKGKYSDAIEDELKALGIDELIKNEQGKGYDYENMGKIYEDLDNFSEALKAFLQSLKIAEEISNNKGIGNAYDNIGDIYYSQQNYSEALKNQLHALRIYDQIGYKHGLCDVYQSLGLIELDQGNYDEALKNHLMSLKIAIEINYKESEADAYGNIGDVYVAINNHSEALNYQFKSLKLEEKIGDRHGLCYSYKSIGEIFTQEKEYLKARQFFDSALTLSRIIKNMDVLSDTYNDCAALDSIEGNYTNAYEDYKNYILYRDSISNEANTKKIVSEQMTFEYDKKQAVEKAEQDIKDARQKTIIWSVVGGLILVLVFAGFIFRSLSITRKQKTLIEKQKRLVEEKNKIVEEKNKDITDSIHYASRIQKALLTSEGYIRKGLRECFILFKPKDIVSGDFYWANEVINENMKRFFICAGDCTGHGVPGAFMSLLNIFTLNEVNIERKVNEPSKILDEVREQIIKALNPESKEDESKDGMDCVLCSFDFERMILDFACANNPLWLVRENKLMEYKPDKMPVGLQGENSKPFTPQTIGLKSNDMVYIFTDGFADQFGGPKGKKFKYKQLQEKLLAISHQPMAEQKQALEQTIESWKGSLEQVDDILIIGIRV
jgi:serine phosphatase RsbU (regulator of sigma subunit)